MNFVFDNLDAFIANYGYFAIVALLVLGIAGPLIPDETILVLSGIAAHQGKLALVPTLLAAFAGSLGGITVSYLIGRYGAAWLLRRSGFFRRYVGRHLPQVEAFFRRYGKWTLFFGYFVAGVRHFTALSAGMSKLNFRTFTVWAYPGGLLWVTSFVSIGYFLGNEWEHLAHRLDLGAIVLAAVIAAIVVASWLIKRRNRNG